MIEKLLHQFIDNLNDDEDDYIEISVGKVSERNRQRHKLVTEERRELEDELEVRKEQLLREVRRKLKSEFEDVIESVHELHKEAWFETYKELGINKNDGIEYRVNTRTGEVKKRAKI